MDLKSLGDLYSLQQDFATAMTYYEKAEECFQESGQEEYVKIIAGILERMKVDVDE
jgi:hypothetical protein